MVMTIRKYNDGYHKGYKGYVTAEEQIATHIKPVAYDSESLLYYCNDGTVGFIFSCQPLPGIRQETQANLDSAMSLDWPDGTLMQFFLFRSPDIQPIINQYWKLRESNLHDKFSRRFLKEHSDWLRKHTIQPLEVGSDEIRIHDTKLLVSCKFQYDQKEEPSPKLLNKIDILRKQFRANLTQAGMQPVQMKPADYIRLMQTIFQWHPDADWRHGRVEHDPWRPISDQIVQPDTAVDVSQDGLMVGNDTKDSDDKVYIQTMSLQKSPEIQNFGDALNYIGEVFRQPTPLKTNYALCTNIYFPNRENFRRGIATKMNLVLQQAETKMIQKMPAIAFRGRQFQELRRSLESYRPVQMATTALFFARDEEEAIHGTQSFRSWMLNHKFSFIPDIYKAWPTFINSLPLCAEHGAVPMLRYYRSMTIEHVPVQLPVLGEWKGAANKPHNTLIARNGQLQGWTLHSGNAGHFLLTATTGSGKSFLVNDVITAYLTTGARIWTLDKGASYAEIVDTMGGKYIDFEDKSLDVSFNPFANIQNWEEQADGLFAIIKAMIFWHDSVDDERSAILQSTIEGVWREHGKNGSITAIAARLAQSKDDKAQRMSQILHQFTEAGMYGKWFSASKRPPWDGRFSVLETQGLFNLSKQVRTIVLMSMMEQIRSEMYDKENLDQVKMLLVDEAWAMLDEPIMASFFAILAREARKYGGLVGLITQTPGELKATEESRTIVEMAQNKLILRIDDTAIKSAQEMSYVGNHDSTYELIGTLQTIPRARGGFSELFTHNATGQGIGRLVVPPFRAALYSTDSADRAFMRRLKKEGYTTLEAAKELEKKREAGGH